MASIRGGKIEELISVDRPISELFLCYQQKAKIEALIRVSVNVTD